MPPNRGQGLNHAINDSLNFVDAVKRIASRQVSREEAMQEYMEEVVARGGKETELSRETAFLTLDYRNFANSAIVKHGLTRAPVS